MNSKNNRSIDLKPNYVKNSEVMSIFYSKQLREYKKPELGIGDRNRIPKYDLPFKKTYRPQITQENFEIVAIATKNLQHIQSKTNKKKLYVVNSTRRS